jgi:hypothetical protein
MKIAEESRVGWLLLAPGGAREALIEWFKTFRFRHSVATHIMLVASLDWPEVRAVFFLASPSGDYETFAHGILREARLAREAGKVVPSGLPRRKGGGRKPKRAGAMS